MPSSLQVKDPDLKSHFRVLPRKTSSSNYHESGSLENRVRDFWYLCAWGYNLSNNICQGFRVLDWLKERVELRCICKSVLSWTLGEDGPLKSLCIESKDQAAVPIPQLVIACRIFERSVTLIESAFFECGLFLGRDSAMCHQQVTYRQLEKWVPWS